MQERLSVGNVKLLNPGGGLPHVHYFPTKGDEPNLVKDENDPAKKNYMRSVVCSKTSLLVLSLLLVALTSYLIFVSMGLVPRQENDDIEELSVTERLLMNHGDSIKYQSIAHNFKLEEKNTVTGFPTEEELSESVTDMVNEKQVDDSIDDLISQNHGRVPTEEDAEEVATEIHSAIHRLKALMNEWSKELNLNSNASEGEFDLTKQPPMDSKETTMAFLVFLIELVKEAHGSIKTEAGEFILKEISPPDIEDVIHPVDETYNSYEMGDTYETYNDDYDDDYKQDSSADRFTDVAEKYVNS